MDVALFKRLMGELGELMGRDRGGWEMAQRDKSQGIGFVYLDIASFLKQPVSENKPVPIPENNLIVNLNKDPASVRQIGNQTVHPNAIAEIKSNLDRLQSLHHKLHVMLEELNQMAERDKKRKRSY